MRKYKNYCAKIAIYYRTCQVFREVFSKKIFLISNQLHRLSLILKQSLFYHFFDDNQGLILGIFTLVFGVIILKIKT